MLLCPLKAAFNAWGTEHLVQHSDSSPCTYPKLPPPPLWLLPCATAGGTTQIRLLCKKTLLSPCQQEKKKERKKEIRPEAWIKETLPTLPPPFLLSTPSASPLLPSPAQVLEVLLCSLKEVFNARDTEHLLQRLSQRRGKGYQLGKSAM